MHAHVVLVQVLSYRLWVSSHSRANYPIGFGLHPYEFRGSYRVRLDPERTLAALTHYIEREVRLDHQVSQLRLVGMLSAQHFTTRFV